MTDPLLSDIDFKSKIAWVWTNLVGYPCTIIELDLRDYEHIGHMISWKPIKQVLYMTDYRTGQIRNDREISQG